MQIKLQKWGNSVGIRIPKIFLKEMEVEEGQSMELRLKEGKIVLNKAKPTLDELLEKITPENIHAEIETGPLMGNEQW